MRFICAVDACGSREKASGMVSSVASAAYLRSGISFYPYIKVLVLLCDYEYSLRTTTFPSLQLVPISSPCLHTSITMVRSAPSTNRLAWFLT